jgi:hypothetical protein
VLSAVGSAQIGALSGNTLPVGIVVLGVFILLLSLLGGVSAYKESRAFLLVYFLFLLLLTLVLFFVGIAVYVERNNASTYITQGWQTATPALRSSLQSIFQCCGCCTSQYVQSNDTAYPCNIPQPSAQQGCLPVFVSYFQSYYVTAGGCGIAFAVIMFVGMLIVCFLMQGIKQKRAEQDLAKLRANNNTDDADIQLAMGAAAAQPGGAAAGDRRRRQQQAAADDEDEEEEEDEEELDEEDETDDGR